jgi:pimeloyl-ACP methyl ester carboxylesterase
MWIIVTEAYRQKFLADCVAMSPRLTVPRLLLASLLLAAGASVAFAAPVFEARACGPDAAAAGARCGVVYVPENHSRPRGRKIGLNVLVLPATGPADKSRAQYDLEGGPGFAATDFLQFYAGEGAAYRVTRDIVLADMRGTGQSNPLRCFGIEELEKRQPLAPMYPPELVRECAQQSGVASDPRQYSTAAAAEDIELVRRALQYEKLDLNAVSYGTTLALRYMARYPARVHAAALMGTVDAGRTPPRFHAIAAEVALASLSAQCAADSECAKLGGLDANLQRALTHGGDAPSISPEVLMEKLRSGMYAPAGWVRLPALIARAAEGDFGAFTSAGSGRVFADGLYLSITCNESFAQMDVDAAISASRATRFGAYRLERQRAACGHWPRAARDPDLMKLPDLAVPVLFIAGELDPVTPSSWAREVAAHFARSRVVVAAHGAHVFDGLSGLESCLDATVIRLFDSGDTAGLDLSCFAGMLPPPFVAAP